MKHIFTAVLSLAFAATTVFAADKAPSSVIHVINVKWTADATPEKIKAVLDFAHTLPSKNVGITRVWTKNIKYQGQEDFKQAIVMEFASEDALKKWADSKVQLEWYKVYMPLRDSSRTHDITN